MDDLFGFMVEENGVAESKPVKTVNENTEDKHTETESRNLVNTILPFIYFPLPFMAAIINPIIL